MASEERQRALRAHIHGLLYTYATLHLTCNYVEFTHEAVTEVSTTTLIYAICLIISQVLTPSLYVIPDTDPASLVLELTLSELLTEKLRLSELRGYQERLAVDQDAKVHLKEFFRSVTNGRGDDSARSDRSWLEDDEGE